MSRKDDWLNAIFTNGPITLDKLQEIVLMSLSS